MNKKENVFSRNRYIIISFFASAALWFIIYLVSQIWFGEKTILRMDLYHQYCPLFAELYDRITSANFSGYSWESGLGSAFWGNYFNYLSSPIGFIVVLFGHKNVPEAIAAMILIKGALSSATFSYYLKKSLHVSSISSVAFSILYSFCGYMLAYYWNVMWLDAMVLLPLVLLGIEMIINHGEILLFTGSLALTMFSNYYMSYMVCVFSVIYFFYYFSAHYSAGSTLVRIKSSKKIGLSLKIRNNRLIRSGFRFFIASLLAGGIMAFCLIPTFTILQACSATSNSFPTEMKTYFNFFDFFANHIASVETTIRSSGDDVLPNVYCGIGTIILAPLFFFTKSISKKEKVVTLILLGIFFISFNSNYLNFIWHGMHFPNDLPYRFSFIYSFILLVVAFKTFLRLNEFTPRQIGLSGAAVIAMIFIITKVESKNVELRSIYISLIFAVIYILIFTLFKDVKYQKSAVAVILCVFVACEVIVSDTQAIKNTVTRESYESDYDEFRELKARLDTIEQGDTSYRMELSSLRTRMDGPWFGYNSASVFSSMAYENTSKLENRLGEMSNDINSFTYNPQTPVFNMMHSLKYVVNNTTPDVLSESYYTKVISQGKYTAYKNNYYLPIGYCVDDDILNWDTQFDISQHYVDPFYVQGLYFDLASGAGDPFKKLEFSYITYNNIDPFTEDINANSYNYRKTTSDSDASATFYLTTKKAGNVYVFFNIDGGRDETVTFNADELTVTRSASQDQIVDLGHFGKGETITVTVPFEENSGGVRLYPYTVNDKILDAGYKKLSEHILNVDKITDSSVSGTLSTDSDCVLYTSIPYDEGWRVYVDGEEVVGGDYLQIGGALLGIKVTKGNHSIEMKYEVQNLSIGIIISTASLIVLALLILLDSLKKRSKKKRIRFSPLNSYTAGFEIYPENMKKPAIAQSSSQAAIVEKTFAKEIISPKREYVKKEIISPPPAIVTAATITDSEEKEFRDFFSNNGPEK